MFNISLTYLQLLGAVAIYALALRIGRFLIEVFLTIPMVINWKFKRQIKARERLEKSKRQFYYEKFQMLTAFCERLNKRLPNSKSKKRFWLEFATSPQQRQYYINAFLNEFAPQAPKTKVVKKDLPVSSEETKKKCQGDCKECSGECKTEEK